MSDLQYQIDAQAKSDVNEVARRTEYDRKIASGMPRASHELADEARWEDEKRKAHPLPGEAGYVSVKDGAANKATAAKEVAAKEAVAKATVAKAKVEADAALAKRNAEAQVTNRRNAEAQALARKEADATRK